MKLQRTGIFGSKEYVFLEWLNRKERESAANYAITSSQERLAVECGSSPTTVNKWLQALAKAGCVEQQRKGCYQITETGLAVIQKMKELEALTAKKK